MPPEGIVEWSNKVWELPKNKKIEDEGFIQIIDNTVSSVNQAPKLSYFKKID